MDVTESSLYRDLQAQQQLMKDRDSEHAQEVDNLQEGQRRQIKDLEESQSKNTRKLQQETESHLKDSRDRYDETLTKNTDSFERQLADERRESYDKFGRAASENARDRTREAEIRKHQVDDLIQGNKGSTDDEKKTREENLARIRKSYEDDKTQLKKYFDEKLTTQNRDSTEAIAATAMHSRDEIDTNTRRKNDELAKQKLGGELRYKQLVQDSSAERDQIKRSLTQREKQLQEQSNLNSTDAAKSSAQAFEQYRERNSDQLTQAINDSNFVSATKDRENSDRLARQEQDHQSKLDDMRYQYRLAENTLKHENESERSRNAIKDEMKERQHQQDIYLNTEAIRKNNNLMSDIERQRTTDQLQDIAEKNQIQMQDYSKEMQEAMNRQEMQGIDERQRLTQRHTQDSTESSMRKAQEQHNLVRAYEQRQNALEAQTKAQIEDQRKHYGQVMIENQDSTQKQVFKNTRENQEKLYQSQMNLTNREAELQAERKADGELKDVAYAERLRKLTETYNRNLVNQKDNFEETTDNLRHESMTRMSQQRGDNEHEKRMQLLGLQSKNRELMIENDGKINQLHEEHVAELDKLKIENDKAMRDTVRKAKETFDNERLMNQRELEAKDLQMKEKLKLQEEAFKEQIEKLKRTHELALKKS